MKIEKPGKKMSLTFKMVAGIWVLFVSTVAIFNKTMSFEVAKSIMIIGVSIAALPLPIDISKIIEKFTGVKK